jgi:maleate isomerase
MCDDDGRWIDDSMAQASEMNPRATGTSRRIGLILPSSNVVVEDLIRQLPPQKTTDFHVARIRVEWIGMDAGSRHQFLADKFLRAAELLVDAEVEEIVWGGTAGLWLGLDNDRALCETLISRFGRPATTASIAFIKACRSHQVRRLALLTPFIQDIQTQIVGVLAQEGISVIEEYHFGITDSRRMADLDESAVDDRIRSLATNVDAVGCVCTNMRVGAHWFASPPRATMPVIDTARECLV